MNRKSFVQQCMAQMAPRLISQEISYERALRASERLWERLTADGLGAKEAQPIEATESCYATMPEWHRKWFDKFWHAYGLKRDKESASRAWLKIKGMDDALAETIVRAAQMAYAESQQNPDLSRKYPQGWLSGRRWEDYDTRQAPSAPENQHKRQLQEAYSELRSLQDINVDGCLDGQIEQARNKIRDLQRE